MSNTIAREAMPIQPPMAFGADMPPLQGSILVVEDENFVREVTAEILVAAGYRVLKARSALEATREFHQHQADVELLLVDVVLPGKSGRTIAKELMLENPKLKTIFISGYPENSADQSSDSFRRTIYLPKPFSLGLLMQKIREIIAAG